MHLKKLFVTVFVCLAGSLLIQTGLLAQDQPGVSADGPENASAPQTSTNVAHPQRAIEAVLAQAVVQPAADQPGASTDSSAIAPAPQTPTSAGPPQPQAGTSNDHMFDLIPNFLTLENAGKVPPLTTGQKFKAVARGAFDWGEFVWIGALSGIGQLENSEPAYHQGLEGYAKRYGSNFGDTTIENFMTAAILPSILKQDPRFYQSSHGSFMHRLGYAASRILITRGDSGSAQFNFSEVLGAGIAATISTYTYHPQSERNFSNVASVWGTQIGYDTLALVVKEFWPDIRKHVFHQHGPAAH